MIWLKRPQPSKDPAIVLGQRIYVIGDIHGRLDLLDTMLDLIDADLRKRPSERARLVFLGDYVDRGDQSAGVIHRLIEVMETYDAICLRGNHEAFFCNFLDRPDTLVEWARAGGLATLISYGLSTSAQPSVVEAEALSAELLRRMPATHLVFLNNRPSMNVSGDYVFVHAGVRPGRSLARQFERDLLWIREEFTRSGRRHEKFVVHGHTPVKAPDVRSNRINIDTGAFATHRLTCLVLEGSLRRFLHT